MEKQAWARAGHPQLERCACQGGQDGREAKFVVHREGGDLREAGESWKGRLFSIKGRIRVERSGASEDTGQGRVKIPGRRAGVWF